MLATHGAQGPEHANSICVFSGLNDKPFSDNPLDPPGRVQSYGFSVVSQGFKEGFGIPSPGDTVEEGGCRGGSNEENRGTPPFSEIHLVGLDAGVGADLWVHQSEHAPRDTAWAMSEENVEIVRRIYDGWERGNMTAGVELFDSEISFESFMPDANERVVANGLEEVEAFMREMLGQWRDFRLIAEEFREVGKDKVFVAGHQAAIGRQSGVAVEFPMCSVWTFRNGKVVGLVFDPDSQAAFEAAGLRE
jgi:ketosteroid isomerase-like protein